jgi:predicted GNAT superfamily acetyltransferase
MIAIRSCSGFDELDACVQLQIETWGYDASEAFPRKAFFLAQKVGGQVIGAFDTELAGRAAGDGAESLVGFVVSWPGVKTGNSGVLGSGGLSPECKGESQPYLHSHMLAVRQAHRNRGIGVRLKLEQRREALQRNLRHMEWTFDPLEIKNAFLNIRKLGAIACRYEVNFYGVSSSRLQGGLPTDRLVAEWALDSHRVKAILEGRRREPGILEERIEERILIPASIYQWKASEAERERALAVQLENRRRFQRAFSQGLSVLGFSLDAEGNGVFELGSLAQGEADFEFQGMKNL